MKRMITCSKHNILAGVSLRSGYPVFNYDVDLGHDVVLLKKDVSGTYFDDGVEFVYGYEYNPGSNMRDRESFRRFLKNLNRSRSKDELSTTALFNEDVEEFVKEGVLALDSYHRLSDFEVTVTPESTSSYSVSHLIGERIAQECYNVTVSFELMKQTYADVQFDAEKARSAFKEHTNWSDAKIDSEIEFNIQKFEELKSTGHLFEMKRFIPKEIRSGFFDFFKFRTEEEKEVYKSLQGVDVLIYDDFLTSGATVKEIIRYLKLFNKDNKLTVFVLVKQY